MVQDKRLYWAHFTVWIYGIMISFLLSGLFGFLFRSANPKLVLPATLSILFFPLIPYGIYGIKRGYCMSYKYGHIYRGSNVLFWNLVPLVLYVLAIIFFIDGENFN